MSNPESLTVEYAAECKQSYLELFGNGKEIILDMAQITDIDLSGLQILIGMIKKAGKEQKILRMTGMLSPEIQGRIACAGICEEPCSTGEQLEQALRTLC